MEIALLSLVTGDASVTALLGDRINWLRRPEDVSALPAMVMQRIGGTPAYDFSGPSGITESRVQFDIWGATYEAAKSAANAVEDLISGYRGTVGSTDFQGIFIDSHRDSEDAELKEQTRLFRVTIDARVWHTT